MRQQWRNKDEAPRDHWNFVDPRVVVYILFLPSSILKNSQISSYENHVGIVPSIPPPILFRDIFTRPERWSEAARRKYFLGLAEITNENIGTVGDVLFKHLIEPTVFRGNLCRNGSRRQLSSRLLAVLASVQHSINLQHSRIDEFHSCEMQSSEIPWRYYYAQREIIASRDTER